MIGLFVVTLVLLLCLVIIHDRRMSEMDERYEQLARRVERLARRQGRPYA